MSTYTWGLRDTHTNEVVMFNMPEIEALRISNYVKGLRAEPISTRVGVHKPGRRAKEEGHAITIILQGAAC